MAGFGDNKRRRMRAQANTAEEKLRRDHTERWGSPKLCFERTLYSKSNNSANAWIVV